MCPNPNAVDSNRLCQAQSPSKEHAGLLERTLDSLTPSEVCIDGVVYDISNFDHPGGESIKLFGGNDVSVIYRMIHPLYSKGHRLDKLQRVGTILNYTCEYKFDTEFERELKREVYKIVPPDKAFGTWGWYARCLFYMGSFFFLQYRWVTAGTSVSLAIIYGLSQALVGLNVQVRYTTNVNSYLGLWICFLLHIFSLLTAGTYSENPTQARCESWS